MLLQLTLRSSSDLNELTVHSISSLNPGNDPESMVAFLPNVRRNTMEKIPGAAESDPRAKFVRKNTLERLPIKSRSDLQAMFDDVGYTILRQGILF